MLCYSLILLTLTLGVILRPNCELQLQLHLRASTGNKVRNHWRKWSFLSEAEGNVAPKQDMTPVLVKTAHIICISFDYCRQTLLEEEYSDSKKMTLISASTKPDDISEG